MLRIGVLSDTHLNKPNDEFKTTVERVFSGVDIVIHAGDMTAWLSTSICQGGT